jgi:hypothetical protein
MRTARAAVHLPSTDDVDELRRKLAELESMVDGLAAKVEAKNAKGNGA